MLNNLFRKTANDDSQNYYQALKAFQLDPNQEFLRVKSRIGLGAATSYAQLFFSQQKRHKRFRRELELHDGERNALNHQHDVIIVLPPHGTLPKHKVSQFLRQSMGIATSAGFSSITHAQLNSDHVITAARRLQALVERKKQLGKKLIIISYSFGSAFVRVMLNQARAEQVDHIKGWLNISGMIFGSPLYHCSDKVSWFNKMSLAQRSFSCEQRHFKTAMQTHAIKVVHVLGLKNGSDLTSVELKQRQNLKAWGPNDGFIPFSHYQNVEQPVLPVMDQGHDVDLSSLGSTVAKTLSSMVSTLPMTEVPQVKTGEAELNIL